MTTVLDIIAGVMSKLTGRETEKTVDGDVRIGRRTYYGRGCRFIAREGAPIEIGKFCSIAANVTIMNVNHNFNAVTAYPLNTLLLKTRNRAKRARDRMVERVVIGNDVWIGRQAIVLPGVRIGHGAVVGAGAIVSRSIPPYAIAAGNPARTVRYRFGEDQIAALLQIAWWDWPDEKIKRNVDAFYLPVDEFIRQFALS